MKKYSVFLFVFVLYFQIHFLAVASEPFRFALFTDLHISSKNLQPAEALVNAVNDVNASKNIDFVLVSGDVSNLGDTISLKKAKQMLDKLKIPYYILPGNHDLKWNEPQAGNFKQIFKSDKFSFKHKGFVFIGFTTAPLTKGSNGYIQKCDIDWTKAVLKKTGNKVPVLAVTHYPLLTGDVDNWKDMTDVLKKCNIQTVLSGHYHRNVLLNYDGIPGIVNRSTQLDKDNVGGYSVYSVSDSIRVSEKRIGRPEELWLALPLILK